MINKGMMSSNRTDWETPQDFFDKLDDEFRFGLDVCASDENHKCSLYFTKEHDGLLRDWNECLASSPHNGHYFAWMNPPYGQEIPKWVEKASKYNCVALLPARTDTRWFHNWIYGKAEIRFIKGRLKFVGAKDSAPFPSMVVVFRTEEYCERIKSCQWAHNKAILQEQYRESCPIGTDYNCRKRLKD